MKKLMDNGKRLLVLLLTISLTVCCLCSPVSATEVKRQPSVRVSKDNTLVFSNLDALSVGELITIEVLDNDGNRATVSVQAVRSDFSGITHPGDGGSSVKTNTYEVSYTGLVINASFMMTVTNNVVTSVYDEWILVLAGTFTNEALTSTSTYGKLSFKYEAYGSIMTSICWLKATATGSNNEITITYKM